MGQSLSKVYVHITFSTKQHYPFIDENIKDSLFEYIGGICKGMQCNPIQIGGHRDHVHIVCLLSKHIPQTKLLEEVKKSSSKWIKGKGKKYSNFFWQDGYAIFSVNPAQLELVSEYVKNQRASLRKIL
jgi:REP element-mobilizing transposase RayT